MNAAVKQFLVVYAYLFGLFTGFFRDDRQRLSLALVGEGLLQYYVGSIFLAVQIIVKLFLDEIAHIFGHGRAFRPHVARVKLRFGLRLKHRLLHFHRHSRLDAAANIAVFKIGLAQEILYRSRNGLLERREVRTPQRRVLSVDKRVIFLAILVGMGNSNLYVLSLQMDYGIERFGRKIVAKKIEQSVARHIFLAIVIYGKTGIEICIVLYQREYIFLMIPVVLEKRSIGSELHEGAAAVVGVLGLPFIQQLAAAVLRHLRLAVAETLDAEIR